MTREIKVGDRVRLTGADWEKYYKGLSAGDVVEVEEVDECGYIWAEGEAGTVGKRGRLYSADNAEETGDYACELVEDETADAVNPTHYDLPNGLQVIDIVRGMDYLRGNVIKYVVRAGKKNPETEREDLLKARKYLDWLIEDADDESR